MGSRVWRQQRKEKFERAFVRDGTPRCVMVLTGRTAVDLVTLAEPRRDCFCYTGPGLRGILSTSHIR